VRSTSSLTWPSNVMTNTFIRQSVISLTSRVPTTHNCVHQLYTMSAPNDSTMASANDIPVAPGTS
jgi:hypothetical protein